jgi:hypothetical protein
LGQELARAKAVVAVIHPGWAKTFLPGDDWVRSELEAAHAKEALVVPVLTGGADEARESAELPHDLAWLRQAQWWDVLPGREGTDLRPVFRAVDRVLGRWAKRRVRLIAAVLLIVGLVLASAGLWVYLQPLTVPTVDPTDVGVVFAPMTETDSSGRASVTNVSTSVNRKLADHVLAALGPGPPRRATLRLTDDHWALSGSADDTAKARTMLDKSRADLLVAPTLNRQSNRSTLELRMWFGDLSYGEDVRYEPINLRGGSEVSSTFSDVGVVEGSDEDLISQAVTPIVAAAQVVDALSEYQRRDLGSAEAAFARLLGPESPFDGRTEVILHHLQGNAQVGVGDLQGATASYTRALELEPGFERSRIGLAEVHLIQGEGASCRIGQMNSDELALAGQIYSDVQNSTESATTRSKALIGRARVEDCFIMAESALERFSPARTTAAIGLIDQAFSGVAAADYAALGDTLGEAALVRSDLRQRLAAGPPPDPTQWRAAGEDMKLAAALLKQPWRIAEADLRRARLLESHPELQGTLGTPTALYADACRGLEATLRLDVGGTVQANARSQLEELRNDRHCLA